MTGKMRWVLVVCAAALAASAEILVKESVPLGDGGYAAGLKLADQTAVGPYLTGSWLTGTAVWTANATSLAYPASLPLMRASGGAFREQYSENGNGTGRATGAALAQKLPSEGELYISCLGRIAPNAAAALRADQAYGIGLTETLSKNQTEAQSKLGIDRGLYFGFGRIGSGPTLPIVRLGDQNLSFGEELAANEDYFFLCRIQIGASESGKDLVSVMVRPCASFDGTLAYDLVQEVDLNPETLAYLKVGGAYASNSAAVLFDELIVATTLYEASGITAAAVCTIQEISDIAETSATLHLYVDGLTDQHAGTILRIRHGAASGALDETLDIGPIEGNGPQTVTLENLPVAATRFVQAQLIRDGQTLCEGLERQFTTTGLPIVQNWSALQNQNAIDLAATFSYPAEGITLQFACGTDESNLAVVHTIEQVAAGAEQTFTIDNLVFGQTYLLELRACYTFEDGTLVTLPPLRKSLSLTGTATILPAASSWSNPASWDIDTLPVYALVDALFPRAADLVETAPQTLGARTLDIESQVQLDLAGSTLKASRLLIGIDNRNARLDLKNANLTLDPGSIESAADVRPDGLTIGPKGGSALTLSKGATLSAGVLLMLSSAEAQRQISVQTGATLKVSHLHTFNENDTLVVDGGKLISSGKIQIGAGDGSGFKMVVRNGGRLECRYGTLNVGRRRNTSFSLENGAVFAGGDLRVSTDLDWGGNNTVSISDSTAYLSGSVYLPSDSRYDSSSLTLVQSDGASSTLTAEGSFSLGVGNGYGGGGRCNFNTLDIQGGQVGVGYLFTCGGAYKANTNNCIRFSRPTARLSAQYMVVTNFSTLHFTVPAGGYLQPPVNVKERCRICGDTTLVLDLTDYHGGYQTLVEAKEMMGQPVTPDRLVILPASKASSVALVQTATTLALRQALPTTIIIR
ncbi:MAG: hypothetical protein SPK06_01920 [Kiritimatiellia bacterium]|nr:hypothetical protein [Kiritimatiellia bacterium]